MSANTAIEWCTHTFNPWWGCTKVSDACTNCYAADWAKRFGTEWGPKARRRFFSADKWREPLKWNRQAEREGVRARVFCASMADVFEQLRKGHPDCDALFNAREQLWDLIEHTPWLDWLLLTKRPENVRTMVPPVWWGQKFPANVWLGTTVENQEQADARIPCLLQAKAAVRFLSCEPLLGPVDLCRVAFKGNGLDQHHADYRCRWIDALGGAEFTGDLNGDVDVETNRIDWVITGGESGSKARISHPEWFRSLRDQCNTAGVPFFFKQWGNWAPEADHYQPGDDTLPIGVNGQAQSTRDGGFPMALVGKKRAGRELDGRTWGQFPEVADVR